MRLKKLISCVLSAAMLLTMTSMPVKAADVADTEAAHQLESPTYITNITGPELVKAGMDETKLQALIDNGGGKVTAYVHMGKADAYSWMIARSGSVNAFSADHLTSDTYIGSESGVTVDEANKQGIGASNKYLRAAKCTKQSSGNYIQINQDEEPIGSAATGNYEFPACGITTSKIQKVVNFSLSIAINTTNTEATPLGFIFSDGTSVTLNTDGTIAGVNDFKKPVCESAALESGAVSPARTPMIQMTAADARKNLKKSIDYLKAMDTSRYQDSSVSDLQKALTTAQAAYDVTDSKNSVYIAARNALEKVHCNMLFKDSTEAVNPKEFRVLSKDEVIDEMGVGTNLGNTLDGHSGFTPSETSWQGQVTTKKYMKALHDAGYNTVRIPVTWGNMINDDGSIKEVWMSRVQEIVDYCISQDMYVILNVHHDDVAKDGGWLDVGSDDIDAIEYKYELVWKTIANRFKDYDEHLIFESMNEVSCMDYDESMKNSADATNFDRPIIMNFNQLFVNAVRSTGSNNTKRWLTAVDHYASTGTASDFKMPTDYYNKDNPRLMFAAHRYSKSTNVSWTYAEATEMVSQLKSMYKKFGSDYPMYLGEYGTRNQKLSGSKTGYNDVERAWYSEIINRACQVNGIVPCVWDQGYGKDDDPLTKTGIFSFWNRDEAKPIYKTITDGMARGTLLKATTKNKSGDYSDIEKDPTITEITDLTPSKTEVSLTMGERETVTATAAPDSTNDVVVWSTDDDSIATVYKGAIHAKNVGTTTVHVSSLSGSKTADITVKVSRPAKSETSATEIKTDKDSYTVKIGQSESIATTVAPANTTDTLSFKSSDESVATVSEYGVITAVAVGKTYITITAASGLTKTVPVEVKELVDPTKANMAINVYYNSAGTDGNYNTIEYGAPVEVSGDGQYTATFDLSKDLTAAGKKAGITTINSVTAIYLQDYDVTVGNLARSNIKKGKIKWDKITVNDTEMTITKNGSDSTGKSMMNGTKIDTGTPINGWDGSDIDGITVESKTHAASFSTIKDPTKITITFTLANVVFRTITSAKVDATDITSKEDEVFKMNAVGDQKDLAVNVAPADATSKVTFVSSDESVVSVDNTAIAPTDGIATAKLTAVSAGKATVTAYTSNGLSKKFTVYVAKDIEPEPTVTPSTEPTVSPSATPSAAPSTVPSNQPNQTGTTPTIRPTQTPVVNPTAKPVVAKKNVCKKVKAKKTKVTVKKGKKATLNFAVTAAKKNAKTTDKMKVSVKNKKIVSVTKKRLAKKKATVTIKAKKKGSTKVTVKVGKKSAKVTVKVK